MHETFVDHAEEIWTLLATGKTQQAVADEIGWSREKVRNFANLENISPVAWDKVVDAFEKTSTIDKNGVSTKIVDGSTITESILRTNILPLTEIHQLSIVSDLIDGTTKAGPDETWGRK